MNLTSSELGYNGNENLKRRGVSIDWTQELIDEYIKCSEDVIYFAEKYIKIVTLDYGLVPITLYDYQKDIINAINNNNRVAVGASRQCGKTTSATVIILHYVLFNDFKTVGLLANKGDSAREILERIKIAYEALPIWLQQGVEVWNKGSVQFENGCKIIACATSSSAIRGKSCVTGDTKVCVSENNSFFYVEIEKIINNSILDIKGAKDMLYTVYKTMNKINGKEYVGFHKIKNIDEIKYNTSESGSIFKDGYMGSGSLIKKVLEKYGPEKMCQELLFISSDKSEAEALEKSIVNKEYIKKDDNYNLIEGGNVCILFGEDNGFYGKKHSKETIEKIQKSRNKTFELNKFTWCELIEIATGNIFYNYKDVYNAYDIKEDSENKRFNIYRLVGEGVIKYKSNYLQEKALVNHEQRVKFLKEAPERKVIKSNLVSKRFKGVPKTLESNIKRGYSIKTWIDSNPEKHTERMNKINKNPDKISKTAEKHRGMKRSVETCKNISESLKGKPCFIKGKKLIHDTFTLKISYIDKLTEIPFGYSKGMPPK